MCKRKRSPPGDALSACEEENARKLARSALARECPPRHSDYVEALMRVDTTVPISLWPVHMVDWITGDGALNHHQRWQCFLFARGNFPGDADRQIKDLYALTEHKINRDSRKNMLTFMPRHAKQKLDSLTYYDVIDRTTRTLSGQLATPRTNAAGRAHETAIYESEIYSKCFDKNARMPTNQEARQLFPACG